MQTSNGWLRVDPGYFFGIFPGAVGASTQPASCSQLVTRGCTQPGHLKSEPLAERIISLATARFVFVVNLSGDAARSFLKNGFAECILSSTATTLLSCVRFVPRRAALPAAQ